MSVRRIGGCLATVLACAVAASCTTSRASTEPTPGPSALSAPTSVASPVAPAAAQTAAGAPADDQDVVAEPVPAGDASASAGVVQLASAALQAWGRPDVDESTWWSGLAGFLTPGAQEAYRGTDPALVPVHTVGEAHLQDTSSTYLRTVRVQTDAGPYDVLLVWQADTGAWLVERITAVVIA